MSTRTLAIGPVQLQANRFALVSRLADDLAHEVKNPLHAMVINLELVRRRIGSGAAEAALDRVRIVEEEVRKVHQIVEALFQLLRPSGDADDPVEVDLVIAELLPLLELRARLARVELGYTPAGDGSIVAMSRNDVKQIVLNLVEAVLTAGAPDGRMRIDVRRGPVEVEMSIQGGGPVPLAAVPAQDAGGAAPTPIGPVIARALAEARGGRLLEESAGDGATVFLVALPLAGGA